MSVGQTVASVPLPSTACLTPRISRTSSPYLMIQALVSRRFRPSRASRLVYLVLVVWLLVSSPHRPKEKEKEERKGKSGV